MIRLLVVATALVSVPVQAQVFKCCNDSSGRVEYRNSPCPAGARSTVTDISDNPARSAPSGDPNARQLTALVAEAIGEKNYNRARYLAVTAEHHQMIREAEQQDTRDEAAARASRREAAAQAQSKQMNCRPNPLGFLQCTPW